jgi:hypothetical protein
MSDAASVTTSVTTSGDRRWAILGVIVLSTLFAAAVTSYIATHLAAARLIGRHALTGLALIHGYDTAFWWTAGILAGGAVVGGALLRRGPLVQQRTSSPANDQVTTARTGPSGGAGAVTGDTSRAVWLQQARFHLSEADPVLARLIDDRPHFDPGRDHLPTQQEVLDIAESWRPYRSLATSYLFSAAFEPAAAPPASPGNHVTKGEPR